jgi:hypothetical protein
MLGVAPQQHPPLRSPPPPLTAPIPREKPPEIAAAARESGPAAEGRPEMTPPQPSFGGPAPDTAPSVAAAAPKPPVPRPNPYRLRLASLPPAPSTALPAHPPAGPIPRAGFSPLPPPDAVHHADPACVGALAAAKVQFKVMPSNEKGGCGAVQPLQVAASGDGIRFSPAATMICSQTQAVMEWLTKDVQPFAMTYFGKPVTAIEVADSYSCRGVNRVVGAKLSEHAAANALDVGAFQIGSGKEAHWVHVAARKDQDDPEAKFLNAARKAACMHFTTVLGPGEPDHDTHFHLDNAFHGKTGTYRICE